MRVKRRERGGRGINEARGIFSVESFAIFTFSLLILHSIAVTVLSAGQEQQKGGDDKVVRKEDVSVYAALILLQEHLPRGTRMTSGFRTASDQLGIIRHDAGIEGLPIPSDMRLDKPNTWRPLLMELRKRGYIIAEPDKTPHSSGDLIVFDLARADLDEIIKACRTAERRGLISISKLIKEPRNRAVHVEMEVTQKGIYALGVQQPVSTPSAAPGAVDASLSSDLRLLKEAHERAKDDPAKQIDIDSTILERLSPTDIGGRRVIEEEIKEHQKRLEEIGQNARKQTALEEIHQAKREGRLEDSMKLAQRFKGDFPEEPEAQNIVAQYATPFLIDRAIDLFLRGGCEDYQMAKEPVDQALKLSPSDQSAVRISREINSAMAGCHSRKIFRIVLGVLLGAGTLVALYYLIRPGKWELQYLDGTGHGQVFELNQTESLIGALGPPDGEADIVISDRKRKISRLHCKIYRAGRKFYIKDESSNGTKVNGQSLENGEYRRLKKNDEISLADEAILLFRRK